MRSFLRQLPIQLDLASRSYQSSPMVFITGPRQIGKTTLIKGYSKHYFNWDTPEVKKAFLKDVYFFRSSNADWILFDEIHKRKDWKKILKGYFDSPSRNENFLVTGSGKLDVYQKGGDSLQGRYELYHLLPITFDEWMGRVGLVQVRPFSSWYPDRDLGGQKEFKELFELGGFPEPLVKGTKAFLNRWLDLYLQRLIREDIRDFSSVVLIDKIELLARLLPDRMKGPLSVKSLSEDLEASRDAVKGWLRLFETLYLGISLKPYSLRLERAVKKEKKWYFFQWAFVEDPGSRFENFLAIQLLSACHFWRESGFGVYELFYVRDQDGREVDFLITRNLKPVVLIEAKLKDQPFPASLKYYCKKLKVPGFLVCMEGASRVEEGFGFRVPVHVFLKNLIL